MKSDESFQVKSQRNQTVIKYPCILASSSFPFFSPHPVCPPTSPPSRRSYSIDKSPGSSNAASPISQRKDINRSESLRVVSNRTHRIFRPSDLIHGEVLGKGCFGQAIKVDLGDLRGTAVILFSCALCIVVILKKSRRWQH